jgi:glycerophosphoryl diester phosphodiesterase
MCDVPDDAATRPFIAGHRGASAHAPPNSLLGFDVARRARADAIELDVRRGPGGVPVLAHGRRQAQEPGAIPLAAALARLAEPPYAHLGVLVDVKEPGLGGELADALGALGDRRRIVLCARGHRIMRELRTAAPHLRLAWSMRHPRHARARGVVMRRESVPALAARGLRAGIADAVTVHTSLVTDRLVDAVHEAGGEVLVWTVNEPLQARALARLGADWLISDDPGALAAAV